MYKSIRHEKLTKALASMDIKATMKQYPGMMNVDLAELIANELDKQESGKDEPAFNFEYEG